LIFFMALAIRTYLFARTNEMSEYFAGDVFQHNQEGWPCSWRTVSPITAGWFVSAPDARGHGLSPRVQEGKRVDAPADLVAR
jgi:hypothetical protein